MYPRILVVLDRSGFGAVLPTVVDLARRFRSSVRLLSLREHVSHSILEPTRESLRNNAERYVVGALRSLPESPVSVAVREGDPDEGVAAEAEAWGADLVVMGQRRRAWLFGTRSDRMEACIARAGRPVLVIPVARRPAKRAANALDVRRVIVAVDGSDLPEAALTQGSALSRLLGVPLTLVLVLPRDPAAETTPLPSARQVERRLLEQENADAYLAKLAGRLRGQSIEATRVVVAHNDPARGILDAARGDLIVMTSHARHGLMRILLGSVSSRVVQDARGPVLVVPPRTPDVTDPTARHSNVAGRNTHGI